MSKKTRGALRRVNFFQEVRDDLEGVEFTAETVTNADAYEDGTIQIVGKHYGPGPHPSGTPQEVHGKGKISAAVAPKITKEEAKELGKKAYAAGKPLTPALDKDLMESLSGLPIGGGGAELMEAWQKGWVEANLADDPVERGGPGSGHWGHRGTPGKRGGSLPRAKGTHLGGLGIPDFTDGSKKSFVSQRTVQVDDQTVVALVYMRRMEVFKLKPYRMEGRWYVKDRRGPATDAQIVVGSDMLAELERDTIKLLEIQGWAKAEQGNNLWLAPWGGNLTRNIRLVQRPGAIERHYGPGEHPGTGTPQEAHAGSHLGGTIAGREDRPYTDRPRQHARSKDFATKGEAYRAALDDGWTPIKPEIEGDEPVWMKNYELSSGMTVQVTAMAMGGLDPDDPYKMRVIAQKGYQTEVPEIVSDPQEEQEERQTRRRIIETAPHIDTTWYDPKTMQVMGELSQDAALEKARILRDWTETYDVQTAIDHGIIDEQGRFIAPALNPNTGVYLQGVDLNNVSEFRVSFDPRDWLGHLKRLSGGSEELAETIQGERLREQEADPEARGRLTRMPPTSGMNLITENNLDLVIDAYEEYINNLTNKSMVARGGPGSGFHGHAGRPGEVGGSAAEGTARPTGGVAAEARPDLPPGVEEVGPLEQEEELQFAGMQALLDQPTQRSEDGIFGTAYTEAKWVDLAEETIENLPPEVQQAMADVEARVRESTPSIEEHTDPETGEFTPEREAVHQRIIKQIMDEAGEAPERAEGEKPLFWATGGLPGAGKSVVMNARQEDFAPGTVRVDSDRIKAMLPGYEGWNAGLLHEESSHIVGELMRMAREGGHDIAYDATLKTTDKAEDLINEVRAAGYSPRVIYVDVPMAMAMERAVNRFMQGGRYVPPQYIATHDAKNIRTLSTLRDQVDYWEHWDNSQPFGEMPTLLASGGTKD